MLSVGEVSHTPVPASLPRDRDCFFYSVFLCAWFPVSVLSSLFGFVFVFSPRVASSSYTVTRSGLSATRSGFVFVFVFSVRGFLFLCCHHYLVLLLFFSARGFLVLYSPHCWNEMRRAITCSILPPRLVFFRAFTFSKCSVSSPWVGKCFLYSFVFQCQDLSANQWYLTRLALDYLAPSSMSDTAPSGFVPRFQRSGDSSLLFASVHVPVHSDLMLPD